MYMNSLKHSKLEWTTYWEALITITYRKLARNLVLVDIPLQCRGDQNSQWVDLRELETEQCEALALFSTVLSCK